MALTEWQRRSLDRKEVDWRRVTYVEADETLDAVAEGGALLVDARRRDAYETRHFPGAIHWRRADASQEPPRDQRLYLYCT